jgi:uncharacterized protein
MKNKFLIWFLLLLFPFAGMAQELPERPNPPKLVNDFTGTLSAGEVSALESKLVAYNDSTSTQIAVVILSSLDGYPVDDYSFQLAEAWGDRTKRKKQWCFVAHSKR